MRVLYFSSDEYAIYAGISMVSMLENNVGVENLEFFLLEDNISLENKEKIKSIFKKYNRECTFLDANIVYPRIIEKYGHKMREYNGGKTGWFRVFPDEIFPDYEGTVLYMDSDTIVNGSIEGLLDLKWDNKAIAAASSSTIIISKFIMSFSGREEERIIRDRGDEYLNSGIVIYHLRNFKKGNFREKMSQTLSQLDELFFIDQTLLNATFHSKEVLDFGYKYNYCFHLEPRYSRFIEMTEELEKKDIVSIDRHPIIVHYPGERPWFKESTSRLANLYEKYRDMSPWKGTELSYWDSPKYKNMKLIDKILERIRRKIYHTRVYGYYSYRKNLKALHFAGKLKRNG